MNRELIAYNATNLNRIWGNRTVPGFFQGSPIVSTDGKDFKKIVVILKTVRLIFSIHAKSKPYIELMSSEKGFYTFIVTNSMNKTKGSFFIVDNSDGSTVFSEEKNVPYAPLGVGRNVERGNWKNGADNSNDMLVWGQLYVKERGVEDSGGVAWFDGGVHFFQLPLNFDRNSIDPDLATETGNQINKTTLSAPAVPKHGMGAYFSFHAGQMRGWSKGKYVYMNVFSSVRPLSP